MRLNSKTYAACGGRAREAAVGLLIGACILLAFPSWGVARSAEVRVSALVAPMFSLSLLTSGNVDFGEVMLGNVYTAESVQTIEVRSNRPWEFVDSSETEISVDGRLFQRDSFLRHAGTVPFGRDHPPGIHTVDYSYTLDLTSIRAFDLPADTPIQATFGYTAVQK